MQRIVALAALALLLPLTSFAERAYSPREDSGRPPRFSLEAGPVTVSLFARAQIQSALYVGEDALLLDGIPAEEAGFRLRRARMGMDAEYLGFTLGVEANLLGNDGDILHEAWVGWEHEYALVLAGMIKVPMSRLALISSEALQHGERSIVVKGLAPEQQLGVNVGVKVWDERVRLVAGVFNGMERGQSFADGFDRRDLGEGNQLGGWVVAARLDFEPLGLLSEGISDLTKDSKPRLGIGGGFLINRGETLEMLGFSGDLAFKWYGLGLVAEYIQLTSGPVDEPTGVTTQLGEVTMRGVTASAGYTIVRKMVEVALRFDWVDEATELEDGRDYIGIGATVSTWFLDGHLKAQAYYEHRLERYGPALENDVFLLQAEGRF